MHNALNTKKATAGVLFSNLGSFGATTTKLVRQQSRATSADSVGIHSEIVTTTMQSARLGWRHSLRARNLFLDWEYPDSIA